MERTTLLGRMHESRSREATPAGIEVKRKEFCLSACRLYLHGRRISRTWENVKAGGKQIAEISGYVGKRREKWKRAMQFRLARP
jgi:hypothetical protein